MRRILAGSILACALLVGLPVSAAAPANFAGTWVLDKAKSKDLPSQMADNIESYTLTVTQDEKQLTAEPKISWTGGGPGGGPGGGRGRGGLGMGMQSATYKLDGSETTVESGGGRPGTATFKAEWKDDGKSLELMIVRKFNSPEGERNITTREHWTLSEDGRTLIIQRSSESPRGPLKFTLAFNKQ